MTENKTKKILKVVVGIVRSGTDKVLIARRHDSQHLGGLWEFPGGKQELGETALQALERELHEELDITVVESKPFAQAVHDYSDRQVHLEFWLVESFLGTPRNLASQAVIWVALESLKDYPFPKANDAVINLLMSNGFQGER